MNVSKRNRTHLIVAFVFALLFLLPATYKIAVLKYPVLSKPVENLWTFELKIHFRGTGKKDTIYHFLPKGDKGQTILREDFISQDLSFTIDKKDGNTGIAWKGSGVTGDVQLFYRATIQTVPKTFLLTPGATAPEDRYSPYIFQFLLLGEALESINVELDDFLNYLTDGITTKEGKVLRIFEYLTNEVKTVRLAKDTSLTAPFKVKEATLEQKEELFIHLSRMAGVPTRPVHGIFLEPGKKGNQLNRWAEVYVQRKWVPVDIENEWFAELPENMLVLFRGDIPFMTSSLKRIDYRFTISQEKEWHSGSFTIPLHT